MVHNFAVRIDQRFGVKRCLTEEHLEKTNSQAPPITFSAVSFAPIFDGLKLACKTPSFIIKNFNSA